MGDLLYRRHLDRWSIDVKVFHDEMRIATFPSGGSANSLDAANPAGSVTIPGLFLFRL